MTMRYRHSHVCTSASVAVLTLAVASFLVPDACARRGAANEDERGYYQASCSPINPCNAALNLSCQETKRWGLRCLCAQHPDPAHEFTFDVRTGACVPVLLIELQAFGNCEDLINTWKQKTEGPQLGLPLGSCKSHHECQVTNAISHSRCNLNKCECECVPEARQTKNGTCVQRRRIGESCWEDEECEDAVCKWNSSFLGSAPGICACQSDFVWRTLDNKCVAYAEIPQSSKESDVKTTPMLTESSANHPATAPPDQALTGTPQYIIAALVLLLVLVLIFTFVVWHLVLRSRYERAAGKQAGRKRNRSLNAVLPVYEHDRSRSPSVTNVRPSTSTRMRTANRARVPEIPTSEFIIDHNRELGTGRGGIVYAGHYGTTPTAIKTLRPDSVRFDSYLDCMYQEIYIFKLMPEHDNIVKLLAYSRSTVHEFTSTNSGSGGSSTSASAPRPECYLILELCPIGSLQTFLRNNVYVGRQTYVDHDLATREQYTELDLLHFAHQIAMAAEFLAIQRIVHGDLALRNVLLATRHHIKIADFGLARRLDDESPIYVKTNDPFPWKWSPPEVLCDHEFSTQSDVWAFGITMWEMHSKGREPYDGWPYRQTTFPRELYEGKHRLRKPELASTEMYRLMMKCWHSEASQRIGFSELKRRLSRMINQPMDQDQDINSQIETDDDGYLMQISAQGTLNP